MLANLELTCGALFSQRVLLALIAGGTARDDAYRRSSGWPGRRGTASPVTLAARGRARRGLDLDAIFDYGHYARHVPEVLARLEEIPTDA